MKKITLYGKRANSRYSIIDDDSFVIISRYRWNCDKDGYAISTGTRLKMHRLIIGAKPGEIVDHINGNKLDNRSSNLRIVNSKENAWNYESSRGSSKFRGVNRANSKSERWEACIFNNGKQLHLGTYGTPEEAAKAYDKKAVELRGAFARTNFPVK